MFEIQKENYDELKICLKELIEKVSNVDNITIDDKNFKIEFYLAADYKMLRILYGHKASNALEGCVWCKYSMRSVPNLSKKLKIIKTNLHLDPLINFIPNKNCLVDLLHLLLRITDQLYKLLFLKFIRIDDNASDDLNLRPNLKIFLEFLKNNCKISNPYLTSTKSVEKIQLRSFNGNERLKIFEELFRPYYNEKDETCLRHNFNSIFKKKVDPPYYFDYENFVWKGFYELLLQIKSFKCEQTYNPVQTSIKKLSGDLIKWLESYQFLNEKNRSSLTITPYIHVFVFHVPEMLEIHHNLNILDRIEFFNSNGKLNEFHSNLNDEDREIIEDEEDDDDN